MALPFALPATKDPQGTPLLKFIWAQEAKEVGDKLPRVGRDSRPGLNALPSSTSRDYQAASTPCCAGEGADNTCPMKNSSQVTCHSFYPV